jgi:hypothetical protein
LGKAPGKERSRLLPAERLFWQSKRAGNVPEVGMKEADPGTREGASVAEGEARQE